MAANPHTPGETSVTIKYGKGYDESWATFRGTTENVTQQINDYFNVEAGTFTSLHDLVTEATRLAHNTSYVAKNAGGQVLTKGEQAEPAAQPAAAEAAPAEPEKPAAFALIDAATDRNELKRIWAENKTEFEANADLMSAWKTKGKSLSS